MELMDHVLDNHLETVRLCCPIKACGRQQHTSSFLRRHLYTVHSLTSSLQPQKRDEPSVLPSPTKLESLRQTVLPNASRLPTYLTFAPQISPARVLNTSARAKQKAKAAQTAFHPYFMEIYEDDDPLTVGDRLVLPRLAAPKRPNRPARASEKVSFRSIMSPTKRAAEESLLSCSQQTTESTDLAAETTEVAVVRRVDGTVVHIPPRPYTDQTASPLVRWSTFTVPDIHRASSSTAAPSSTRASSLGISLHHAVSSRSSSVLTPLPLEVNPAALPTQPPNNHVRLDAPGNPPHSSSTRRCPIPIQRSTHLTQLAAPDTAFTVDIVAPSPPTDTADLPTIGFRALSLWHRSMRNAAAAGMEVENPFEQTGKHVGPAAPPNKRKGKGRAKAGRPAKRVKAAWSS